MSTGLTARPLTSSRANEAPSWLSSRRDRVSRHGSYAAGTCSPDHRAKWNPPDEFPLTGDCCDRNEVKSTSSRPMARERSAGIARHTRDCGDQYVSHQAPRTQFHSSHDRVAYV